MEVNDDNDALAVDFDMIPYCECGKENILLCNAEICDAQWIPAIYIDPDWPDKEE